MADRRSFSDRDHKKTPYQSRSHQRNLPHANPRLDPNEEPSAEMLPQDQIIPQNQNAPRDGNNPSVSQPRDANDPPRDQNNHQPRPPTPNFTPSPRASRERSAASSSSPPRAERHSTVRKHLPPPQLPDFTDHTDVQYGQIVWKTGRYIVFNDHAREITIDSVKLRRETSVILNVLEMAVQRYFDSLSSIPVLRMGDNRQIILSCTDEQHYQTTKRVLNDYMLRICFRYCLRKPEPRTGMKNPK